VNPPARPSNGRQRPGHGPRWEREEIRFLTRAEVAAPAEVIVPRYRVLVMVGAYGGLRIGELAGLRRSRVDLLRGPQRGPRPLQERRERGR
jgi:integrase